MINHTVIVRFIEHIVYYFYNTLIHKGEILEKAVRKYHPNLTALAEKLGYKSRSTLYEHFSTPDLADGIILKYGKALKYTLQDEFPELYQSIMLNEPPVKYGNIEGSLEGQVELWKDLYYQTLAENNKLLQELMAERAKKR